MYPSRIHDRRIQVYTLQEIAYYYVLHTSLCLLLIVNTDFKMQL